MFKLAAALFGLSILIGQTSAAPVTIFGDRADTQVHFGGIFNGDPGQNGGQSGFNAFDYSMVYVFQLPSLGANQIIADADFSFFVTATSSTFDTDLYGLGFRPLPDVLVSDWYTGPGDPNNTLIQEGIVAPSFSFTGRVATSVTGDAALANYLNAQYAAGAVGGDYVFLRLSSDTIVRNTNVNFYYAADQPHFLAGILGQETLPRFQNQFGPKLDVTVGETLGDTEVPEPSSVVGVAMGLVVLVVMRRRRIA